MEILIINVNWFHILPPLKCIHSVEKIHRVCLFKKIETTCAWLCLTTNFFEIRYLQYLLNLLVDFSIKFVLYSHYEYISKAIVGLYQNNLTNIFMKLTTVNKSNEVKT
jgi:hypothetical protein